MRDGLRRAAYPTAQLLPLIVFLLCPGCAPSSALDQADGAKFSSFEAGSAGFDIETVQARGDSLSAVDLYLSIPYPSLIFEKAAAGFRSRCEITARISDRHTGQLTQEVSWAETTFVERYETTQSSEPIMLQRRIDALPGSYHVDVTLEDLVGARKITRKQNVTIIDPATVGPALGRVYLIARRPDGTTLPQVSFFVQARTDSFVCTVGAYNFPATADSRAEMRVLRFATDTNAAIAPFKFSIFPLSSGNWLIDFDRPDTQYCAATSVRAAHRTETLEFRIPPLRRGMYRIEFTAATRIPSGGDTTLSASRYYSINGPGFPRPVTFNELIEAAAYVATEKEMTALRQVRTQEEQRKKFEGFWLSSAGDPERAAALIKRYYARVEEANKLFTNCRDGWKTDRGMLYCVLGPPAEITDKLDTQTWYYDTGGSQNDNTYVFKRFIRSGEGLTVEDYILYRQAGYQIFWERMVSRLRGGEPL